MPPKRTASNDDHTAHKNLNRLGNLGLEESPQNKPNSNFNNDEYTIGWICANPINYVAARAFLDTTHEGPDYVSSNDTNDYTLGEIENHKIVIAFLSGEEYSISSTTSYAKEMLHTFPNIKICLVVGIGGGAPSSNHDIRLGDIVVGLPRNGNSGSLSYDLGRSIKGLEINTGMMLDPPQTILLAAVSKLRRRHESDGHNLGEVVTETLRERPRLGKNFQQPDLNTDILYKADVVHPNDDEGSCSETCGHDPSHLIQRSVRDESVGLPAIHYGLIASSNLLMKNGVLRDRLSQEHGVLCFDMEIFEFMNHFPALAIRGICDYSDTHNNRDWQGYAAMTASAYAKSLLKQIPVSKIETERRITEIISSVDQEIYETRHSIQDSASKQQRADRWLKPSDPSINYKRALSQRQKGTGNWLLRDRAFEEWKTKKNSFLGLYGMPGCGKTVLSSTVIEHLMNGESFQPYLFFYFEYANLDKNNLESLIRSLISQLFHQIKDAENRLYPLISSHSDEDRQSSLKFLWEVFFRMLDLIEEVWIVIDALDEFQLLAQSSGEQLFRWIKQLLSSPNRNVHLLTTSRTNINIERELDVLSENGGRKILIQNNLVDTDIREYIRAKVRESEQLKRWRTSPEVQELIEKSIMTKSNGIFRWVSHQIDDLQRYRDLVSLEASLNSLPQSLNETYRTELSAIRPAYKPSAIRIFQFMTFSDRPLTVREVVDILAVDTEIFPYFNPAYLTFKSERILDYCSGLLVFSPSENDVEVLQFARPSIKDYLLSREASIILGKSIEENAARLSISRICLTYLLQFNRYLEPNEARQLFPLAQYAAAHWSKHLSIPLENKDDLNDLIEKFLDPKNPAFEICYSLHRPDDPYKLEFADEPASPLYYASFENLLGPVKMLLDRGAEINAQGGVFGSPIAAACFKGNISIVQLLLDSGANPNALSGFQENALQIASSQGHTEVVKLLLESGADFNASSTFIKTAIQEAFSKGNTQLVDLLLGYGAKFNVSDEFFKNTPAEAKAQVQKEMVGLLVGNDVELNIQESATKEASIFAPTDSGYASQSRAESSALSHIEYQDLGDEDIESVFSDSFDIHSQTSEATNAVESQGKAHMAHFFAEDPLLRPLCSNLLERMNRSRFPETFRKLLKPFYQSLLKEATTYEEHISVHLLRSRRGRLRIGKMILDLIEVDSGDKEKIRDCNEQAKLRANALERWFGSHPSTSSIPQGLDLFNDNNDRESERQEEDSQDFSSVEDLDSSSEEEKPSFPHLAGLEKFLRKSKSFQVLLNDLRHLLLTQSSREVLQTIPKDQVWLSMQQNKSFINQMKAFVEDYTRLKWNWWPLEPRMRVLQNGETRLFWRCSCGARLWKEISITEAELIDQILPSLDKTPALVHRCEMKRADTKWRGILHSIYNTLSPQSSAGRRYTPGGSANSLSTTNQNNTNQPQPQHQGLVSINQSPSTSPQASPPASSPSSPQMTSTSPSTNTWVIFGVKGSRRALEISQIGVNDTSSDSELYRSLRENYRINRGKLRLWFSFWRLGYCEVVKFKRIAPNFVIREYKDMPDSRDYKYNPRPPKATNPPISPHEFYMHLNSCDHPCPVEFLHQCMPELHTSSGVDCIPKRTEQFETNTASTEKPNAWGLEAIHEISFAYVTVYHVIFILIAIGFWIWWMKENPGDIQGAAVPLCTVVGIFSLFWSTNGILTQGRY